MDLSGRRRSTNVEDRRGKGGKIAGIGIGGGGLIAVLLYFLLGGNAGDVLQQLGTQEVQTSEYTPSAQEEQLREFAEQILASTEDVWDAQFKKMGKKYVPPRLYYSTAVCRVAVAVPARQGVLSIAPPTNVYISIWISLMRCQSHSELVAILHMHTSLPMR